jgi:small nuclear ribonucleoprotein (snRNP)-like protein
MNLPIIFKALLVVVLTSASVCSLAAERETVAIGKGDTISTVLTAYLEKSVLVKLESGDQMSGIVKNVGRHLLYLTTLKGLEYYDAVIRINAIESVIIRVRN